MDRYLEIKRMLLKHIKEYGNITAEWVEDYIDQADALAPTSDSGLCGDPEDCVGCGLCLEKEDRPPRQPAPAVDECCGNCSHLQMIGGEAKCIVGRLNGCCFTPRQPAPAVDESKNNFMQVETILVASSQPEPDKIKCEHSTKSSVCAKYPKECLPLRYALCDTCTGFKPSQHDSSIAEAINRLCEIVKEK